ncbi:MAG: exosortase-associated EpsI family protein [Candidatus Synoicihabitans palmerolidicus]|nr:exosortase-associated EpsI family protein [Candidatus Synoicihabitans palmerolidicus]
MAVLSDTELVITIGCVAAAGGGMVRSQDVAVSDVEQQIYAGATVLKRVAQVRGPQVVLTIIDGTKNRHAVHDPLFCFRGAGWEVLDQHVMPVEIGEATRVTLSRRGEQAEALYWFTEGEHALGSAMTYWWRTTLRRVTLGASGQEPVLVVLTSVDERSVNREALLAAWPELGAL